MEHNGNGRPLRVLELYCGIGGCTAALDPTASIVAAVDVNRTALTCYRHNFGHPTTTATIESLSSATLESWQADLWWMSPPCQPFTTRGLQRDTEDPRSRSFLALIERLLECPPTYLGIENVPGFRGSRTHTRLLETLAAGAFEVQERLFCPTTLGIPNRRLRFYLVAGRRALQDLPPKPRQQRPLTDFLDPRPSPELSVDAALVRKYRHALNVVDLEEPRAVATCFTSAYGHSPVRSGSYLRTPTGLRRFSPNEILRLLGFPETYSLPPDLPLQAAWHLVGNSLSVPAARHVLSAIPELAPELRGPADV
jgi:site-specific DNA-cytosine methylase